ncbi:MAG: TrbC/VirB2 family protein [Luteibacter sp.]
MTMKPSPQIDASGLRLQDATPFLIVAVLLCMIPDMAFAQAANDRLPYEAGLATLRDSLTGPVPFIISLVGIVACGAMLIFGGEISGFLRTMVFLVLVISIIVQATAIVELFGGDWDNSGGTRAVGHLARLAVGPASA